MKYDRRAVAFVDILGFSDIVSTTQDHSRARHVISILNDSFRQFEWRKMRGPKSAYDVRLFSDSACITSPPTLIGVHRLLYRVASIQLSLIARGILTRGGIAFGKHYSSCRLLFSEGLVAAYRVEQRAVFPRVVLSLDVAEFLVEHWVRDANYTMANLLLMDSDEELFVAYLSILELEDVPYDRAAVMKRVATTIRQHYSAFAKNARVIKKIRWLQRYYNFTAELMKLPPKASVGRRASGFKRLFQDNPSNHRLHPTTLAVSTKRRAETEDKFGR